MPYTLMDRMLALSDLVGHADIAYIEADRKLEVLSWNKGAVRVFGFSEDDAMKQHLYELVPLSKRELIACAETTVKTFVRTDVKGFKIPYILYYSPIMQVKGEKYGVAVLAKEVQGNEKEKVQVECQDKHLEDIYEFAPMGIFHVNKQGNVVSANSEYAWMLGYESAEVVADQISNFAEQTFYDPDKAEEFMFGVYEAEEVIRFRARLKKKDDSFVWAMCYAKATKDEDGRLNGFNGFSIDISEMVRTEDQLKKANEKLQMLSVLDGLTGIPNRRRFDEYLEAEWKRHFRDKNQLSIIMCDIDFFKLYNDNYGHQAGDDCLIKVAGTIAGSAIRASDLAARYGGEEFVLILPNTDAEGAMTVAEEVRTNVQTLQIPHELSKVSNYVSLSLGVATMVPEEGGCAEDIVAMADKALYKAKESGRNRSIGSTGRQNDQ